MISVETFEDLPNGYRRKKDGIHYEIEVSDDTTDWHWLCSPISVLALTRGTDSKGWGRLVEIINPDGTSHRWAAPATLFAGFDRDMFAGVDRRSTPGTVGQLMGCAATEVVFVA